MSPKQVPSFDQQAAHKDAIASLSEHLTTTSISSAPENHKDEKPLIVEISKVELNDAIESARRARQVDDNGQHVCGPNCPLRGAVGHGGVETST
ncbi:MAG: Malate dehydrogenase [Aureobasidium pullulans]|nr:MAG: Malate dehydrogenase [Aureobasidium pullulans]